MNQFSAIIKIGVIVVVLAILAVVAFPLAIVAGLAGIPLMVYYAWFSPDHAFPKFWQKPF